MIRQCACAVCGKAGETSQPDPVYCSDECMATLLKPGQTLATCRKCGAKGAEDARDPAPGLCPECYEAELIELTGIDLRDEVEVKNGR